MGIEKRSDWIDITKCLAIMIMVAGHIGLPAKMSSLIHIFHMPVFFILAGMVFDYKRNSFYGGYLSKRFRGLIVPYIFWGLVSYLLFLFFSKPGYGVDLLGVIVDMFTSDAAENNWGGTGVLQWFYTCMFFVSMISWTIIAIESRYRNICNMLVRGLVIIIFMFLAYVGDLDDVPNVLGINSALLGIVFFLTGYMLRVFFIDDNCGIKFVQRWYVLIMLFLCVLLVWITNGKTNMRIPQYNNIILYSIGAYAGSFLLIDVSSYIELNFSESKLYRLLLYYGKNTAVILSLNRVVQKYCSEPLLLLFYSSKNDLSILGNMLFGVSCFFIEFVLFIPIIYFVNKYLPFTIGRT